MITKQHSIGSAHSIDSDVAMYSMFFVYFSFHIKPKYLSMCFHTCFSFAILIIAIHKYYLSHKRVFNSWLLNFFRIGNTENIENTGGIQNVFVLWKYIYVLLRWFMLLRWLWINWKKRIFFDAVIENALATG